MITPTCPRAGAPRFVRAPHSSTCRALSAGRGPRAACHPSDLPCPTCTVSPCGNGTAACMGGRPPLRVHLPPFPLWVPRSSAEWVSVSSHGHRARPRSGHRTKARPIEAEPGTSELLPGRKSPLHRGRPSSGRRGPGAQGRTGRTAGKWCRLGRTQSRRDPDAPGGPGRGRRWRQHCSPARQLWKQPASTPGHAVARARPCLHDAAFLLTTRGHIHVLAGRCLSCWQVSLKQLSHFVLNMEHSGGGGMRAWVKPLLVVSDSEMISVGLNS